MLKLMYNEEDMGNVGTETNLLTSTNVRLNVGDVVRVSKKENGYMLGIYVVVKEAEGNCLIWGIQEACLDDTYLNKFDIKLVLPFSQLVKDESLFLNGIKVVEDI